MILTICFVTIATCFAGRGKLLNINLRSFRTTKSLRVVGGAVLFALGYFPLIETSIQNKDDLSLLAKSADDQTALMNALSGKDLCAIPAIPSSDFNSEIGCLAEVAQEAAKQTEENEKLSCLAQNSCDKHKSNKTIIASGPYNGGTLISGKIKSNFYVDAKREGIPAGVIDNVISKLSSKINFRQSLKKGDSFEIAFNGSKDLLFAKINTKKSKVSVYKYGKEGYFFENGQKAVRVSASSFGSPLKGGMRISSRYGFRRHPVTGKFKRHTGVDLKANYGTPVYAIYDGVVTRATSYSGYGKCVDIAHKSGYSSRYAHLSRFAVRSGSKVKKGQLIGYSGSSGVSTGPHLHLELAKNSKTINPLSVKMIPEEKAVGTVSNMKRFASLKRYVNNLNQDHH